MNEKASLIKIIVILFLCLLVLVLIFCGRDYTKETLKFDASVVKVLKESKISEQDLSYKTQERYKSGRHLFLKIERHYDIARGFDTDEFLAKIKKLLKKSRFKLEKSVFEKKGETDVFSISFSFKNRILYNLKLLRKRYPYTIGLKGKGAKIAIVLDDFGYNMNNIEPLFEVNSPLTISILPRLPYSEIITEQAFKNGFEVILHLPLEPHSKESKLEEGTIMVDMSGQKVNELLTKAIESVPKLKGVSNHMGSKALEDSNFMQGLFMELKKRDLYFLDNLVTDKSVCREVAKSVGLRTAARSVFLDNESNEGYIEKQIFRTANLAAKTGWAIGVGHDRANTIKVLAKVIPQLKKAGFEFVYVSELVK